MTKLKTKKKMNKSTIAIIIMAVVMVAMLAFGGTYAYFTATSATRSSEFHVGKVALTSTGTFTSYTNKNVVPGDKVLEGSVSYINQSTVDTYVAVVFDILYDGGYYVHNGTTWSEVKDTNGWKNLTNAQINEAFKDALKIGATNSAIDSSLWTQGGGSYTNIYLKKGKTADAGFRVAAPANDKGVISESEEDRKTIFVNATTANPVKIDVGLSRKYVEEVQPDGSSKVVMSFPEKNGTADWKNGDIYLEWENADIKLQFTAYQIQADNIGDNGTTLSGADEKDFNKVWEAMKDKVGYGSTAQNFIKATD